MSYATSLLAAYPSSYGPSTLLSDDLVTRSSYDNLYPSAVPYMSSGRLLSDDLAFNQINHKTSTTYRPPLYPLSNSTSVFPTKKYQNTSAANWRKTVPLSDSFASSNDITEYSDSLGTASNTNTASSVARSINDNHMNMFSNYNQMLNDVDGNPQLQSVWSSPPAKKKGQSDQIKTKSKPLSTTIRTHPSTNLQKKSSTDKLNDDRTPVQSPKQQNHLQRNATTTETEKESPSIDIQAWMHNSKKDSPINEKSAEQVWSVKTGQLHLTQAQREKDKAKSSRALPHPPKKVDNKPIAAKTKSIPDSKSRDNTYQTHSDSYFDSLFDGDYFRKPTSNDHTVNSSFHPKPKPPTTSFNNPNPSVLSKSSKYVPPRKTPRYEPPTTKRAPPTITTTSWRKQHPKQYHFDSLYPYYLHNEYIHHDMDHKDTDERYREALQKLRADRAEQQQNNINEKTAKRLNYGDYVRHSTKDALLQNAVKPSPWSDFMHLKKGNLYSLSREEKKQRYNQSKSYGERVRYRNFAIRYGDETARSRRHSVPLSDEGSDSSNATPRQTIHNRGSKSVSRTSRRPDSGSTTNRSYTKQSDVRASNRTLPHQGSRATVRSDRSNHNRPSADEYEYHSDYDANRKYKQPPKKKNVRIAKYDSSGRTTSGTEESDNENENHSQQNTRVRNRDVNDDLFTVREEKTLESFEGARYKKR